MFDDMLNLYIAAFLTLLSARLLGAEVSVSWMFAPVVAFIATCAIVDILGAIIARKVEREGEEEETEEETNDGDSK